ncbi:unnamed protein product [Urochloa decumbens]|uniref:LEAF RUST 10 DISEASE-RESISTANCE LOCUS RECEPTOR-LIKE PROTEIN KINASE-like 1.2 n=1 Tax=Urochloa decumbens TaxID=240449 RepID=A0ABC8Z5B5_9POAL
MAAHLPVPRLPFLLFVFLAVHVPASHGNAALLPTTYDGSICSDSVMCGTVVSISYPFYLSNRIRETANYTSYSCGYTDLEIFCQGEGPSATPVVRLGGNSYTVLNILYDSRTIILADSDVLIGPRCPKPSHNVTFDYEWLRYNYSSYDNLTFFYNCYFNPGDSVPPSFDKNYQINYTELPSPPGGFVFSAEELGTAQDYGLPSHCKEIVTVPVRRDALKGNDPYMLARGYVDVLKMGFELEWNRVTTDQCYMCEESGGQCAYGQSRAFLGCLCSGGKVGNPDCKNGCNFPRRI